MQQNLINLCYNTQKNFFNTFLFTIMKSINSRAKGQRAEREIANILNNIIAEQCALFNATPPIMPYVQRNQNQSAVGGADLINTFDFAIEIKNCQTLQIKKWWQQTVSQAEKINKTPILLFRQNRKGWHFTQNGVDILPLDDFLLLFADTAYDYIYNELW